MNVEALRGVRSASWIACWLALTGCMPDGTVIDPKSLTAGASGAAGVQPAAAGSGVMAGAGSGGVGGARGGAAGNVAGRAGGAALLAGSGGIGAAGRGGVAGASSGSGPLAGRGAATAPAAGGSAAEAGSGGAAGGAGASGRSGAGAEAGSAGDDATDSPTFAEIYALFVDSCNGCHGPGEGGLKMSSADEAHANLVDVDARSCSGQKRVVPGDPEASILFLTVDRSSAGDCDPPDMPRGGAKWSQANIDKLKAWIEAGAPKD